MKQVLIGCFCLLMLAGSAMGAVRYVDAAATGANNGGSPANAWTDLSYLDRSLGNVSAGDTVIITAGEYTNYASVNLQEGSSGNWTRYCVTNGLVHVHRPFGIKCYTELNGALDRAVTATDNLYALDSITNNIGLWIDRHDVTNGLVSGLYITGEPTIVRSVRMTGAPSVPSPGDTIWNVIYDFGSPSVQSNEFGYCWIDYSSGRGTSGDMAMDVPGTTWANWNVHHSIFENNQSDVLHPAKGTDFHHNIVRNRAGAWGGGCNDTFVIGDPTYVRIFNNLIEAADNTLYYLWGAPQYLHDFYFYNNVLTPVRPQFQVPTQRIQGSGIQEQDTLTQGLDYQIVSNIFFVNNTWISTTNDSVGSLASFLSKNGLTNSFFIGNGAMHFLNNLSVVTDTNAQSPRTPFAFAVWSSTGSGFNDGGKGWFYNSNSVELDYNWWGAYTPGNVRACSWGQSGGPAITIANAADVRRVLGYSHNVSDNSFRFVDAPNWNYQPATPVNVGTNLTSLLSVMPSINQDVYGNLRPASGAWPVGAANQAGPVFWLTFARDDGWTTNGVVTDRSGSGNTAYQYASANRNTLPGWTNGPTVNGVQLDAAQFVVNRTNRFTYGTYLVVPLTNSANQHLVSFTNGTWALWAWIDQPHLQTDNDDIFLTTGQQKGNWMFGKYYSDGPQFSRVTTTGGQEPMQTYSRWPNLTNSAWHHYAVTWDGTNWLAYLDGVAWTNSAAWTNGNSFVLTNHYTGTLVSTNSLGGPYNWMSVGVNTHGGTPNPDDGDGLPNNGQLWGRLADVRIYNRALSGLEIRAIANQSQASGPVIKTLNAGSTRR